MLVRFQHSGIKGLMVAEKEIKVPLNFTPREYQRPFIQAMKGGKKRAVCVWHRRAGKDKTFLNFMIPRMFERKGAYYYYFPTQAMGRDILWDGIDKDGFKFIDHFPAELIAKKNDAEMKIELKTGSIFKIRGTDRNEPIGVNPVGVVFSEFSRQNPKTGWDLVRPILAENGGWAVFNFTPRGKNHAHRLYRMAQENPDWFCQKLDVNDTQAIPLSAVEDDRKSGMSEEMIQQEYFCSFDVGQAGSYYGRLMAKLWEDGHMSRCPYEQNAQVYTFWDLGIGDSTAIWFAQFIRQEIHVIDYYENHGESIHHYIKYVKDKPYIYAQHFGPHDLKQRSLQTGQTMLDTAAELGIDFEVLPPYRIEDGIEAVRSVLPLCWFNLDTCRDGIDALENYHSEFNEKRESYSTTPCHDWSSHGADAMRYLAMAYRYELIVNEQRIGYPHPLPAEEQFAGGDVDDYDPLCVLRGR